MSLEELLKENNARLASNEKAMVALTDATNALLEMRGKALEVVQGQADAGKAPTKAKAESKPKADEKPKETAKETKPEISANPENRADPDSPLGKLRAAIGAFVGMDDDPELVAERGAVIQKFFAHPKINAKTASDVPEKLIPAVISNIEKVTPEHKAKSDEKAAAGGGGDSDDLDLTA